MTFTKRILFPVLLVLVLVSFCACGKQGAGQLPVSPTETATVITEATVPETTIPETTVPETEPPPEHSELYIPGISVEDVILWFNEVCLDAEFKFGGDATLLQKWTSPIPYVIYGDYTGEDYATLTSFIQWLNTIEGFPGMYEIQDPVLSDLEIHLCTQSEMVNLMGDHTYGLDGAVTFWYTGSNEIYEAIICCRTDLDQHLRNSVILEEIYNGLGPVQDTELREDSIAYAGYSEPQELTAVDELILKLLYHPDLVCGMTAAECEAVIRQLYY